MPALAIILELSNGDQMCKGPKPKLGIFLLGSPDYCPSSYFVGVSYQILLAEIIGLQAA